MKSNVTKHASLIITLAILAIFSVVGIFSPLDAQSSCEQECKDDYDVCKAQAQSDYDSCMNSANEPETCDWIYELNISICSMNYDDCMSKCD